MEASFIIDSRYPLTDSILVSYVESRLPGQPPVEMYSTSDSRVTELMTGEMSPLRIISANETSPVESPDSYKDIVRIRKCLIRPVPLCTGRTSLGTEDPVSMNCPLIDLRSTSDLTASHIAGTSCHSSIRCGTSPSKAKRMLNLTSSLLGCPYSSISPNINAELELFNPIHVLPHHLGPSTHTAPKARNDASSCVSAILVLYPFGFRVTIGDIFKCLNTFLRFRIFQP